MDGMMHNIEGYSPCESCGTLVIDPTHRANGGMCAECRERLHPLAEVEIINRGARIRLRPHRSRRKERTTGIAPRGQSPDRNTVHNAREAAWARLATIHRDLFNMLYDEERARRGLPPIARYTPEPEQIVSETLSWDAVYSAVDPQENTDGATSPAQPD